ncbi:MAG TPA: ArsR family transcriptional regulator [Clostridiales bacterium]|nr:ArsR family transcriptional regulator [Clostridiales bacterium]
MPSDLDVMSARLFKAFAHPVRVALLEALRSGPKCVCELVPLLDVEQPSASNHLSMLRSEGLIVGHKEGRRVIYRLTDDTVPRLLDAAHAFLEKRWQTEASIWRRDQRARTESRTPESDR